MKGHKPVFAHEGLAAWRADDTALPLPEIPKEVRRAITGGWLASRARALEEIAQLDRGVDELDDDETILRSVN